VNRQSQGEPVNPLHSGGTWGFTFHEKVFRAKGTMLCRRERLTAVSIVQNANASLAVRKAVDLLGGIENFLRPHDKVVIKPNLVFALDSDTGFTTDPRVVGAIIQLCKRMNPAEIVVAEGSGGADTKAAYQVCGYSKLAKRYDVELVDLNETKTTEIDVPSGKALRRLRVPDLLLNSDVLINVPKLKLYKGGHWASLSVKNLMGCIPGRGEYSAVPSPDFPLEMSPEFWKPGGRFFLPHHGRWWGPRGEKKRVHANLAEGIVDLNTVIHPSLTIIEAMKVSSDIDMTQTKGERSVELDTILAGADPLALDRIATNIGGFDALNISYLRRAAERGLGESRVQRIRILGTPLERVTRSWKDMFDGIQGRETGSEDRR